MLEIIEKRGQAPLLLTLLIALTAPAGQQGQGSSQDLQRTHVISMGAWDKEGRLVRGITPESLLIEKGKAKVRHIQLSTGPRRYIVLLDTSGSMGKRKSDMWANTRQVAQQFVAQLGEGDEAALHLFADEHEVLVPWTRDSRLLWESIEALDSGGRGRTQLGLALDKISRVTGEELRPCDAIVLISDGLSNDTKWGAQDRAVAQLTRMGVRLILIYVPTMPSHERRRMEPGAKAEWTADASGGTTFIASTRMIEPLNLYAKEARFSEEDTLLPAAAAYQFARTCYRVEVETAEPLRKKAAIIFQLMDGQGRPRNDVTLNYPRYLQPFELQKRTPAKDERRD